VKRLPILVIALLVGAAAPARAWCEATCLAPPASQSAKPHCPSHEPSPDGAAISAADGADCPVIESARPIQAKLDFALAPIAVSTLIVAPQLPSTNAPGHSGTQAPRQPRSIPLRL
jgi:hypothetical protein